MKYPFLTAIAAVTTALAGSAHANLVLMGPQDFGGTGLGAVNTVLTIQGNGSFEQGSVSRTTASPTADVIVGADVKTGASQTQTRTAGSLGITSASNLRVVFNAVEPQNAAGQSITLDSLQLIVFNPTTGLTFTSGSVVCPTVVGCAFPDTFSGAGNSGFVFGLDATQAAALTASGFGANSSIGLFARASKQDGGPETFFVANSSGGGGVVGAVPEPETYALMMAGLGMLGFVAKRRNKV